MAETPQDFWGNVWGNPGGDDTSGNPRWSHHLSRMPGWLQGQSPDLVSKAQALYNDPNDPDAFNRMYDQWKTGAMQQGYKLDATDANNLPLALKGGYEGLQKANQSPAQQWNAQPAMPTGPTAGTGGQLMQLLMQRAQQGPVDRNNPNVRAQADAFRANEDRSSRNYIADLAEKHGGAPVNLQGEQRMAAERAGQRAGAFEAELIGREQGAVDDRAMQSLGMWGNLLSMDERMALERELAQMSDRARTADRSQANDQFLRELALREFDTTNAWDYRWMGL